MTTTSYAIRVGGTSDFISEVLLTCECCNPPGEIAVVPGWENPKMLRFDTWAAAHQMMLQAESVEDYCFSIEEML